MKTFRKLLLPVLLCEAIPNAWAQTIVSGRVYDALTKEPLSGIAVVNQLRSNTMKTVGTVTDIQGRFSLPIVTDSIGISGLGYRRKTVRVTGKSLTIALEQAVEVLQTIVVTASRDAQKRTEAPVAISTINARTIEDTKLVYVYELVNKVPSVVMLNYNNEQHGMSIRQPMGTSAYFLYLEDGIPIRPMGVFNHNALIEMNVFSFSSIEVVKGPVSSLYGPEAVGGRSTLSRRNQLLSPPLVLGCRPTGGVSASAVRGGRDDYAEVWSVCRRFFRPPAG